MQIKKFDSINVIPFIDIMLVLLVIVLTTASFVSRGLIPLDLTKAVSSTKMTKQDELNISIKKDGQIYFNKIRVQRHGLKASLAEVKKDTNINISCDKNAYFYNFVYVIDILKDKGYTNLGIVTKYE